MFEIRCLALPIVLKACHLALHLQSAILIIVALSKKDILIYKNDSSGKLRGMIWLMFEIVSCVLATTMLISALVSVCTSINPPKSLEKIRIWFAENCPNFSLVYYVVMSLFVFYGSMIGCNIPGLFYVNPKRTNPAQSMLIAAVCVSIINSVLYFVAAFFPFQGSATAKSEQAPAEQGNPLQNENNATNKESENKEREDEATEKQLNGTGNQEDNVLVLE